MFGGCPSPLDVGGHLKGDMVSKSMDWPKQKEAKREVKENKRRPGRLCATFKGKRRSRLGCLRWCMNDVATRIRDGSRVDELSLRLLNALALPSASFPITRDEGWWANTNGHDRCPVRSHLHRKPLSNDVRKPDARHTFL